MKAVLLVSVLGLLVFLITGCPTNDRYNTGYKNYDTIVTLGVVVSDIWQELPKDESGSYLAHIGDLITIKTAWVNTISPDTAPYSDIGLDLKIVPTVNIEEEIVGPMPTGTFSLQIVHYRRSATWAAWEKYFTIIVT